MRKLVLTVTALAVIPILLASTAHATLISIGLQEGGGIVTEASSLNGFAGFSGSFGTFTFNNVSATGSPILSQPNFDTTSLQASATSAGTINVFATEQGLTAPLAVSTFLSAFTSNVFNGSALSVVEQTFVSTSNALYGGTLLATQTFTGLGASSNPSLTPSLTNPFSETIEYTVTVGAGSSDVNDTVDIASAPVPEPVSLALLGSGLIGLGMVRRRRLYMDTAAR